MLKGSAFILLPVMSDDDGSVSETNNFLRFQWDVDDGENESAHSHTDNNIILSLGSNADLHAIVRRISIPCLSLSGCIICKIQNLRGRNHVVQQSMGTMALCRGARGGELREAGAIWALLETLWGLMLRSQDAYDRSFALLPQIAGTPSPNEVYMDSLCDNHLLLREENSALFSDTVLNELEMTSIDLANSCLGALRDLACGSALNRAAILRWAPSFQDQCVDKTVVNGVHVLSAYVKRYDQCTWEEILSLKQRIVSETTSAHDRGKKEIRLLTNALGAVRNASHSTPDVCQEFFNHGLVDSLVWRLMLPQRSVLESPQTAITLVNSTTTLLLPGASCPWREACFRAAGSLINLAEKCPHVAQSIGSNRKCIHLLIETWGGASAMNIDTKKTSIASTRGLPLLHLGLAAILHAAEDGALGGGLDEIMMHVLENEKMRKGIAQRQEVDRKRRQSKAII